ncbi:hypothetical protein BXZ70DRAFT_936035 [Cristinia sonorae]|uniref:G-protein coupled receptors family 1 profile domain-containing protein n=1 Tax=Cristinia sonorae TaxID=1940300 RepID=A0A8K0UNT1_9AGAR|nr:hypothetical protein BXZ70DRAFT_936035 [Cristinia sonorae]
MSGKMITQFQDGQHSALIAAILCASLTLIAVNFVWGRLAWVVATKGGKPSKVSRFMPEPIFFRTQLGAYVASLLLSNMISCVGYFFSITWLMEGGVTSGLMCTAQGAMTQVGDLATAYFTAAIAVHTFCTLALRNRPTYWAWIAVVAGWVITLASGLVPAFIQFNSGPVYGTDGATCGISLQYPLVQLLLHLIPVLVASLVASVFYALVFLNVRGTLSVKGGVKFTLDPEARWKARDGQMEYIKFVAAIAKSMLIFPIAYVSLMMPHIVLCLVETSGWAAPFSAKVFAMACAALLGVFNVVILYNTLRIMGPAFNSANGQEKTDVESFATPEKSPVDVAPSVSAVIAQRAFPPVRTQSRALAASSRQPSVASIGGDSTTNLLPPRAGHAHSNSSASSTTLSSLQRSITPVEELNELIIPNAPMNPMIRVDSASSDSDSDISIAGSLPAPRRPGVKKPHLRRPTVPAAIKVPAPPVYVVQNGMLSAVNLQTATKSAAPEKSGSESKKRDSFISMYTSRTPVQIEEGSRMTFGGNEGVYVNVSGPTSAHKIIRPYASTGNFAADRYDMTAFTSPRAAPVPPSARSSVVSPESSPEPFTSRPAFAELPLSPFAEGLMQRAVKSPEHSRSISYDNVSSPAFGNMSALAKDAVVRNAAKKNRRRSKSLDLTPRRAVPDMLRPGTPSSARGGQQMLPSVSTTPMGFTFPATPRTPGSSLRPRSPAPPLPALPSSRSSPQPSARRLPTQPGSASFV